MQTRMCKVDFVYVLLFISQKEFCNLSFNPNKSKLGIERLKLKYLNVNAEAKEQGYICKLPWTMLDFY
jgi:hypothetical protein